MLNLNLNQRCGAGDSEYKLFGHFTVRGKALADMIVYMINKDNPEGGKDGDPTAYIGGTYWDYGAGISWETILVYSSNLDLYFQLLEPNEKGAIDRGLLDKDMLDELLSRVN